jgi:hypothetical protein
MRRTNNVAWPNRVIHPGLYAWGRLKPGVNIEQARVEMKAIAARLEKAYPESNLNTTAAVTPLMENLVGKYRINLALLLGAVVLGLIACANLANLSQRGAARARICHAFRGRARRSQIVHNCWSRVRSSRYSAARSDFSSHFGVAIFSGCSRRRTSAVFAKSHSMGACSFSLCCWRR